jgi:hypothetical protein
MRLRGTKNMNEINPKIDDNTGFVIDVKTENKNHNS